MHGELTTPRLDQNRAANRRPETVEHHPPGGPNGGGWTLGSLEGPALYVARELLPKITNVIVH